MSAWTSLFAIRKHLRQATDCYNRLPQYAKDQIAIELNGLKLQLEYCQLYVRHLKKLTDKHWPYDEKGSLLCDSTSPSPQQGPSSTPAPIAARAAESSE